MGITASKRNMVYQKTGGRCQYCGGKLKYKEMIVAHVVPLSRGGTDATENLVPACVECSRMKALITQRDLEQESKNRRRHKRQTKNIRRKRQILAKTDGLCAYCGTELTLETMTVDHIVAASRGGGNGLDNLVPACRQCNHRKDSMTLEEFNAINRNRRRAAILRMGKRLEIFFRPAAAALRRLARHLRLFRGS